MCRFPLGMLSEKLKKVSSVFKTAAWISSYSYLSRFPSISKHLMLNKALGYVDYAASEWCPPASCKRNTAFISEGNC